MDGDRPATTFGLPTERTWHVTQSDLRAARPLLAQLVFPLRPAPGLVFLAAMVCGVVAMLASVLLHASDTRDRMYPGIALIFPLCLLAFACSQNTPGTMAVFVVLFVAAGALTFATARADLATQVRQAPATTSRRRGWVSLIAVTACTMAAVVLVAVLVNANEQGAGAGPGVAPAVALSAESLTSNLLAVEIHDANDVIFQANSAYRTYWQVAVLNVLRNGVWVPDPDTQNAAHGTTGGAAATQSQGGATAAGEAGTSRAQSRSTLWLVAFSRCRPGPSRSRESPPR